MLPNPAWQEAYGEPIDAIDALAIHARIRAVFSKIAERFERSGVRVIAVKGALLAHQLYRSPVERPLRDLDLRVRYRDLASARRTFLDLGGRETRTSSVYRDSMGCIDGVDVDIESHLGPPMFTKLGMDVVLARSRQSVEPLGFLHWQAELHDHVLLLVVNVFKDHLNRASSWSFDDLVRIVRLPEFDPELLGARAREAGLTTVTHLVAMYLATFRDDGVWREIAARIAPARRHYADLVWEHVQKDVQESIVERALVRASADSPARAVVAVGLGALREVELRVRARR